MIEFVDINNGKIYNGEPPYIHWFDDNCSINLIYNRPICFISDKKNISIQLKSSVFFLIDTSKYIDDTEINNFIYKDINDLKTDKLILQGTPYKEFYIYIFYVGTTSSNSVEYVDDILLDNDIICKVGAIFYDNEEKNKINLSNFGINIPNAIQKSIYPSNVHEDLDDNVLLNRKWRELLTNYWDMIANRGSYKSLINSLKWFEWGDILRLREMWKYNEFEKINKLVFEDRELKSVLKEKYKDSLCRFAKSTYIALYITMQKLTGEYDVNKIPIIEEISTKWSKIDLMLKLSLLGSFYETYFMPIHMDLMHATIEDIVFTDTFKLLNSTTWNREDYIYDYQYIHCNIEEGHTFLLSNVHAQVGPDTVFGTQWTGQKSYDDIKIIGVDDVVNKIDDPQTFWSQNYNGIGSIIPIELDFSLPKDFVKNSTLCIHHEKDKDINGDNIWYKCNSYKIFNPDEKGLINIKFKLLCTQPGKYEIRMQFITGGGKIYTRNITFNIADISNAYLRLFKIEHIKEELNPKLLNYNRINNYIMSRSQSSGIIKYISIYPDKNGEGVALNNILIFKQEYKEGEEIIDLLTKYKWIKKYYFINIRDIKGLTNIKYTICISKTFWHNPGDDINNLPEYVRKMIIRNEDIFFPEFHTMKEIVGYDQNNYFIYDHDTICVVPSIKTSKDEILFKYGNNLDEEPEWEFENISTGESIKLQNSIQEPFISCTDNRILPNGYYNIRFKYKLNGEDKMLVMNSAFCKK